ncbi:tudor and KH domain-containing protein isoform X2 [Amia ocellicauda]|uniref:tudor and KH domain-containing protein isoform X2 n=1 Tax=Amia ocellicauda TaxID=2972642 RepID=UPI003463A67E
MAVASNSCWSSQPTGKKVALALGLPLGATVGYLMYRRYKSSQALDCSREGNTKSQVTMSMEVYRSIANHRSSFLSLLCQESGAQVEVEPDVADPARRTFVIHGSTEQVCRAKVALARLVTDCEVITDHIEVPQTAFGRIIGRGGESIKALCRNSGARINCPREKGGRSLAEKGTITLTGTRKEVEKAKELIMEKVMENEVIHRRIAQSSALRQQRKQPAGLKREEGWSSRQGSPSQGAAGDGRGPQANCAPTATSGPPIAPNKPRNQGQEKPSPDTDHTSSESSPLSISKFEIPSPDLSFQPDEHLEVYVSAVENPQHFWIQILGVRSLQLDKLTNEMSHYYNNQALPEKLLDVVVGDIVAAPYRQDETWYRARVLDFLPGGLVDLYYVDFGDNGEIPLENLCSLRSDFLSLPFQAMECSLAGVCPAGEAWTEEALDEFDRLTYCSQWKPLLAKLCSYSQTGLSTWPNIQLYDNSNAKVLDLGEEMVRLGHAVRCQDPASREGGVSQDKGETVSLQKMLDDVTGAASELSLSCLSLSGAPDGSWATETLTMQEHLCLSSPTVHREVMRSDMEGDSPLLLGSFISHLDSTPTRQGTSCSRDSLSTSPVHNRGFCRASDSQVVSLESPLTLDGIVPGQELPPPSKPRDNNDHSGEMDTSCEPCLLSQVTLSSSCSVEIVACALKSVALSDEVFSSGESSSILTISNSDTSTSTCPDSSDSSLNSPRGCYYFVSCSEDSSLFSSSLSSSSPSVTTIHSWSSSSWGPSILDSLVEEEEEEEVAAAEVPRSTAEKEGLLLSVLEKQTVLALLEDDVSADGPVPEILDLLSGREALFNKMEQEMHLSVSRVHCGEEEPGKNETLSYSLAEGEESEEQGFSSAGLRPQDVDGVGDAKPRDYLGPAKKESRGEHSEEERGRWGSKKEKKSKVSGCKEHGSPGQMSEAEKGEEFKGCSDVEGGDEVTVAEGSNVAEPSVIGTEVAGTEQEDQEDLDAPSDLEGETSSLTAVLTLPVQTVIGYLSQLDVCDAAPRQERETGIIRDCRRDPDTDVKMSIPAEQQENLFSLGAVEGMERSRQVPGDTQGHLQGDGDPGIAAQFGKGDGGEERDVPMEPESKDGEGTLQENSSLIALDDAPTPCGATAGGPEVASISGSGDDIIEDQSI